MIISAKDLETLMNQRSQTPEELSEELGMKSAELKLYMDKDDFRQFPEVASNRLKDILLKEEEKNLAEYKGKFSPETVGYFSNHKILNHPDKLLSLKENPKQVGPITVEFHPTNKCTHACPACTFDIPNIDEDKRQSFNIDLLDNLINNLLELEVKAIDISGGGEPLCHGKIDRIIELFAKAKFDIGLVTNGQGLSEDKGKDTKRKLRYIILSKCKWCRISVDAGSQKTYSKMHGNDTDIKFDNIVNKIKLLAEDKIKCKLTITLGVSFLLTPTNFRDLEKSIETFREIKGIDYFQVKPIVIDPSERTNKNFIFWDKSLFESLIEIKKKYETKTFKVSTMPYKFADMLSRKGSGLPFTKCWGHPFYPTIAADGSVLVCCHMLNNLLNTKPGGPEPGGKYGTITGKKRFLDIWNSDSRYKIGEEIEVTLCPHNCKLSETNKLLDTFMGQEIMHENFIN
jgi:MoaA/NifB/PqqE/SkfB family radical SAM enzyme